MKTFSRSIPAEEADLASFRSDPERGLAMLNEAFVIAFEENDPSIALYALRLATLSLGYTRVAKTANLPRESVHRMLSPKGNPEWRSLFKLLRAHGLRPKWERVAPASS